VVVNNAEVLPDRVLVNMSVEEWDVIMKVHLRGHSLPDAVGPCRNGGGPKQGRPTREAVGDKHLVGVWFVRQYRVG